MKIKTRVFEFVNEHGRYKNLVELAQAMGISSSQVYRVRAGERHINEGFIIGAFRAFPEYDYKIGELFYIERGGSRDE